jgi:two-component system NtrC family sensor kinase
MSASPGDTQPVFDLIVRRAVELCNAQSGGLFVYDGERVHIGTIHGLYEHDGKLLHVQSLHGTEPNIAPDALAAYLRQFPMPPKRGSISMRAILDCQIMHIRDMREEVDLLEDVQRLGHRSQVSLPLLRDARAIGVITIAAHEPGGFSDSQVALLKTFAEQAVIAITSAETYRALRTRTADLQESLEYQTATSDVLKVISRTEAKLESALETLVATAARICAADQGAIHQLHDGLHFVSASFGTNPEYRDYVARNPIAPGRGTAIGRMALERRAVHIKDVLDDPEYSGSEFQRLAGFRSVLAVPRDDVVIGSILLTRSRVEPFTDKQIALVRTFADQAVIAIENTRLVAEQREA